MKRIYLLAGTLIFLLFCFVFDQIKSHALNGGAISYHPVDIATYGSGWDGKTDHSPTLDAIYDYLHLIDTDDDGDADTIDSAAIGENLIYLTLSDSIDTVIAAATAGDSLILGAGTYTITDDIDVTKSLSITGQGRGITNIVTTTDSKNCFHVTVGAVTIQDLSIDITASGTKGIYVNGTAGTVLSGVLIKDVDITMNSHAGAQTAIHFVDASGEVRDVIVSAISSNNNTMGILLQNNSTAEAATTLKCYNVDVSVTAASSNAAFYSHDNSATNDCFLYLYNCTAYATGGTDYAVRAHYPDAYLYAESCVLAGDNYDVLNSNSAGILQLRNCNLVNNLTSGTITYQGRIGGATYGSDGSVTDAELLYLDATSSIQTQLDSLVSDLVDDTTPQLGGDLDLNNQFLYDSFTAFTDADTDPDVSAGMLFKTANTGATTIADFDTELTTGHIIYVLIADSDTTVDFTSSGLKGHGGIDWTPSAGDSMLCVYDGTDWDCIVSRPTSFSSVVIGGFSPTNSLVYADNSGDLASAAIALTEFIPVSWMVADGTTDPDVLTEEDNIQYRDFADDATEELEFMWRAPFGLTGATVKVQVVCVITNGTAPADTEGVSWNIASCSITGNESHDCSVGTLIEPEDTDMDDHASAQWDIVYIGSECVDDPDAANGFVAMTPTGLDNGELVKIAIERDHDDAIDDYGQDIGLVGLNIKYQFNVAGGTY